MMELPEAIALARQIDAELTGRMISRANCGNHPHKWAFYNRPQDEYASVLPGKRVGSAAGYGSHVTIDLELCSGELAGRLEPALRENALHFSKLDGMRRSARMLWLAHADVAGGAIMDSHDAHETQLTEPPLTAPAGRCGRGRSTPSPACRRSG